MDLSHITRLGYFADTVDFGVYTTAMTTLNPARYEFAPTTSATTRASVPPEMAATSTTTQQYQQTMENHHHQQQQQQWDTEERPDTITEQQVPPRDPPVEQPPIADSPETNTPETVTTEEEVLARDSPVVSLYFSLCFNFSSSILVVVG
jgi:hypothetical protein